VRIPAQVTQVGEYLPVVLLAVNQLRQRCSERR
jgi:hypothetical protein